MEGYLTRQAQGQGGQQQDPHEQRIVALKKQTDELYDAYNSRKATLTEKQHQEFREKAYELQNQMAETVADRRFDQRMQQAQRNQPHPAEATLMAEFNDVYSDPRKLRWAMASQAQAMLKKGIDRPTIEMAREHLRKAQEEFGGGPPRESRREDLRDRRHFSGPPRGANGTGQTPPRSGKVVLGKIQQRMAMAMFPNDSRPEACKKWVKATKWSGGTV
jgi:hypothetical protein